MTTMRLTRAAHRGVVLPRKLLARLGKRRSSNSPPSWRWCTSRRTSGARVAVPQSCLDAVDESQASLDLLDQATQAISELDAARLQTIVDDWQSASERIRDLGKECRATTDVTIEDTTASPTS